MTTQPLGIEGPALLALNIFEEARGEIDDGRAAVALVTLNRTRLKYESAGSIESTVLWPNAFSWTEFAMAAGKYQRVAHTPEQQIGRVRTCLAEAQGRPEWTACRSIAQRVMSGAYDSPNFHLLTPKTVLYFNPSVCKAPYWADPKRLVCKLGHHWFFEA